MKIRCTAISLINSYSKQERMSTEVTGRNDNSVTSVRNLMWN